mgnify:CR=1 FL=1
MGNEKQTTQREMYIDNNTLTDKIVKKQVNIRFCLRNIKAKQKYLSTVCKKSISKNIELCLLQKHYFLTKYTIKIKEVVLQKVFTTGCKIFFLIRVNYLRLFILFVPIDLLLNLIKHA